MIDLKKFRAKAKRTKAPLVVFLKKFDKKYIPSIQKKNIALDAEVWQEVDCLACANCCKSMTPTFTHTDMNRIADYLQIPLRTLIDTYFTRDDSNGDIINQSTPCQWLDLKTNMCSIYEVRPADCAGFPHHTKRRFDLYNHVYEQNLDKCPATNLFITKLEKWVNENYKF